MGELERGVGGISAVQNLKKRGPKGKKKVQPSGFVNVQWNAFVNVVSDKGIRPFLTHC